MNATLVYNVIMDCCGVLILLLSLLPYLGSSGKSTCRRKRSLLINAMLIHLFTLLFHLAGALSALALSGTGAADILRSVAILPALISAALLALCVLCDETGAIRLSNASPVQVVCSVLPPVLGRCLRLMLPQLGLFGLSWSVALQLNQIVLQFDSEKRLESAERQLNREQALLMSVQMQPHFIFNTLSSIEALCQSDPGAAAESVENLSGYLRGNLDALSSEALIPFDEELRHIRQYVALELSDPARQFIFDYELDVRDFSLPALTVEPIVENAVKHGALTHPDGKGRVLLCTEAFGETIRITVTDNGTDSGSLTDRQRLRRGVGIESTRKRLSELCGGSLSYRTGPDGARAVILIPRHGRKRDVHTDR